MPRPDSQPSAIERQPSRHLSAVKRIEAGGDIGQERGRKAIAGCDAGASGGQRQQRQFDEHRGDERARGHADRAHRSHHRQSLFEGQTVGRVNDEQSDETGEQPESGQVQMEAFGQPPQVGLLLAGRAKAQRAAGHRRQRRRLERRAACCRIRRESCPGRPSNACAMPMSTTSSPGGVPTLARIGGSAFPPSMATAAPGAAPRSRRVSGAAMVSPGGAEKALKPSSPARSPQ